MRWVSTIIRELIAIFVDDVAFAAAIIVWLVVVAVGLPRLGVPTSWDGFVLFGGLALLLIASAVRRAR